MKQLSVISGKGGTGKTTLVGSFAHLARNKVLADCDVDASNLYLLLKHSIIQEEDFKALKVATIDKSKCTKCGRCVEHCRFNAISNSFVVEELLCEGCGVCTIVCPVNAVSLKEKIGGKVFVSETEVGPLCHAILYPGEEASGKLVTLVRDKAKRIAEEQKLELIIIDASPGIGCPVIASIGGVDLALIVAEPSISGVHDLKRILKVTQHFGVKAMVCINKYDLNLEKSKEIERYCKENDIMLIGKLPYDECFTKAMVEGKSVIEYGKAEINKKMEEMWDEIERSLR